MAMTLWTSVRILLVPCRYIASAKSRLDLLYLLTHAILSRRVLQKSTTWSSPKYSETRASFVRMACGPDGHQSHHSIFRPSQATATGGQPQDGCVINNEDIHLQDEGAPAVFLNHTCKQRRQERTMVYCLQNGVSDQLCTMSCNVWQINDDVTLVLYLVH